MTPTGWTSALDSFAEHLGAQEQALQHGRPTDIVAFTPPAGLGPVPAQLLPRARELSARADALVEAVATALSRTTAALAELGRNGEAARPSYVDSRL